MIDTPRLTIDTSLLERIVRRDAAALSELYDRVAPSLYGLISRILHDEHEAEDVLQEVFLRVWQKAESFDKSLGSPLVWLVRIAHNLSIDRLRSKAMRRRDLEESLSLHANVEGNHAGSNPHLSAESAQQCEAITRAISRLPEDQRKLIEYAYFQGYTQSQLAVHFGIPLGTVKTRIRAAMSFLREQLRSLT